MEKGTDKIVLLVDDEPEILEALKRTLRDRGYVFLNATSGEAALAHIAATPEVDLVITDIDMPEMSGMELVKTLRRTHPHIPRIILTGVASLDAAIEAINEGEVHRFLLKPWDATELRAAVEDGLERTRKPVSAPPEIEPAPISGLRQTLAGELSPRLLQILDQLLTGAAEKEIAAALGISTHTTHGYVKTLYRRVGARSRAQFMSLFHVATKERG